jgi:hypothetical protein
MCARRLGRVIWGHVAKRYPLELCAGPSLALAPGLLASIYPWAGSCNAYALCVVMVPGHMGPLEIRGLVPIHNTPHTLVSVSPALWSCGSMVRCIEPWVGAKPQPFSQSIEQWIKFKYIHSHIVNKNHPWGGQLAQPCKSIAREIGWGFDSHEPV